MDVSFAQDHFPWKRKEVSSMIGTISQTIASNDSLLSFRGTENMANSIIFFLLMTILIQSAAQNIRTLRLFKIGDTKYQCVAAGCAPSTIIVGSYLRGCQVACLSYDNCRTVTFDPSSSQCELFADKPAQRGQLLAQAGVLTMFAIDDRPVLPCKL
jgi:hypothetical protein